MNRRTFLRNIAYGVGAAAIGGCSSNLYSAGTSKNRSHSRPNIVFIMADDHATGAIGCYGSTLTQTPNIDRLAKEGMRFTHCFNVNSLCAPSRAALLTGKHSCSNGFLRNFDAFDSSQTTFPKLLQSGGYETAIIGKWHLRTQPQGFDYYNLLPGHGWYFNPVLKGSDAPWKEDQSGQVHSGHLTDIITDLSIDWLKSRTGQKPFCLMVHHKAPHTPHDYPDKYAQLYKEQDLAAPQTFDDSYAGKNPDLAEGKNGESKLNYLNPKTIRIESPFAAGTPEHKQWAYQTFFKGYLRLIAGLDENIGRLLDYLESSGLMENTLIVYTSDNGFFLGDHGLYNKMWMYEESLRLPLLVRYPDEVKAGSVNRELVSLLDFAPTFLDYAQVPIPDELQGRSIRTLLRGKQPKQWRTSLFYQFFSQYELPGHIGIRTKDYKLIAFENKDTTFWEFYDLKKDPRELTNQYHNPRYKRRIEKLKSQLTREVETLPRFQPKSADK